MNTYETMNQTERSRIYEELQGRYRELCEKKLSLNMARGKPGAQQLNMVSDILTVLSDKEDCVSDGIDVRNYGNLSGIPAAKRLFAEILGCKPASHRPGWSRYPRICRCW